MTELTVSQKAILVKEGMGKLEMLEGSLKRFEAAQGQYEGAQFNIVMWIGKAKEYSAFFDEKQLENLKDIEEKYLALKL